jgi:hypothetical protein
LQLLQPNSHQISRENRNEKKGCPQLIPGLRSFPFWSTEEFPWIISLEGILLDIIEEFHNLKNVTIQKNDNNIVPVEKEVKVPLRSGFQRYLSPKADTLLSKEDHPDSTQSTFHNATDAGSWNVCYFHLNGINFEQNISHCPKTMKAIQ